MYVPASVLVICKQGSGCVHEFTCQTRSAGLSSRVDDRHMASPSGGVRLESTGTEAVLRFYNLN